jgi:hypothetical protein
MSEPTKENPKTSKRSKRKPAMEPLGWDEIVSQPGMGGYLSFLNGPIPLPHLQGSGTALAPDPGVFSHSGLGPGSDQHLPSEIVRDTAVVSAPQIDSAPDTHTIPDPVWVPDVIQVETIPGPISPPGVVSTAAPAMTSETARTGLASTPEVVSIPAALPGHRLRIRRCAATHDGHSLGEEVLYQAIWKAARPESAEARTIVIGWRGMSQLCRMTPKNCKINTQRLMRKLALEVLSPYNTPESIGTTYRVYSDQAILERRRAAGLEWVVRSRGVEFVDPATGSSIMPICAHTC